MAERLEVQRAVAAPAGEIFAVLSDPRGHVAIDSSGMLMEASGAIVAVVDDIQLTEGYPVKDIVRRAGQLG